MFALTLATLLKCWQHAFVPPPSYTLLRYRTLLPPAMRTYVKVTMARFVCGIEICR